MMIMMLVVEHLVHMMILASIFFMTNEACSTCEPNALEYIKSANSVHTPWCVCVYAFYFCLFSFVDQIKKVCQLHK